MDRHETTKSLEYLLTWINEAVRPTTDIFTCYWSFCHILRCSVCGWSRSLRNESEASLLARRNLWVLLTTAWSCFVRIFHQRHPPGTQAGIHTAQGPARAVTNWATYWGPITFMEERDRAWAAPLGQQNSTLFGKSTMWCLLLFMDTLWALLLCASEISMSLPYCYFVHTLYLLTKHYIRYCRDKHCIFECLDLVKHLKLL